MSIKIFNTKENQVQPRMKKIYKNITFEHCGKSNKQQKKYCTKFSW